MQKSRKTGAWRKTPHHEETTTRRNGGEKKTVEEKRMSVSPCSSLTEAFLKKLTISVGVSKKT